uniref:ADF-H domain-containing protein n=1 Tax=Ascaris lumbricoides TaxID=6252 RepID=A0A0M3HHV9_ASCLU
MRNMEIKARIDDLEECQEKASKLCDGQTPILLYQHDTFFRSPRGRLKLRVFKNQDSVSELIFYDRPDCDGPKLCDFHKASVEDPENLKVFFQFFILSCSSYVFFITRGVCQKLAALAARREMRRESNCAPFSFIGREDVKFF